MAEVWRHGSVVGSWLVDLTADALARSPELAEFGGRVSDSGEGRWTVEAAIDESVPAPVITAALFARFESRGEGAFAAKVLSAMRSEFGGHAERPVVRCATSCASSPTRARSQRPRRTTCSRSRVERRRVGGRVRARGERRAHARAMFAELDSRELPWEHTVIYQVDERVARSATPIAT